MRSNKNIALFITGCFFLINTFGYSADRYWVAAANTSWSYSNHGVTNWSTTSGGAGGASIPGSGDIAIFNSSVGAGCAIDAAVNVAGISVSGYTGTISQGANTIIVGTSNAIFSSGTFTGGSAAITCNGTFTLSGASFTSTSGILTFNSTVTYSSGTFVNGSGTVTFNSTGAQIIPAWNYFNLTSASSGTRTLASSGTIGISAVFTKGTNSYTNTGSTINYNGTSNQTVIAFNYNNLTISGARTIYTVTLAGSGTIGVASVFSYTATFTNGSCVITGSIINYNGTGAQTIIAFDYNSLTISGARTTNNVTLANSGTINIKGAFTASATFSTGVYVNTGSTVNYSGVGAQTIAAFNYNHLTISGTRTVNTNITLANAKVIGIAGTWLKSAVLSGTGVYVNTGSTIDYNGNGQQTVIAFKYNNLTISGARTSNYNVLLESSDTIKINRVFLPVATFSQGNYVSTGSTIEFNGTLQQTIPPFLYNNIVSSSTGGRSFATTGIVNIAGTLTKGSNTYTNNGINGEGFTFLNSKVATHIAPCTVVSVNEAYAAGDNGVIIKTTDGGTTWNAQNSGTATGLRDIEFYDIDSGLAIGLSGLVLRTTNGGSSWSSSNPTNQTLSGIYYMTSSNVLISCANGTVLKSINGGASWSSPISTGTTQALYAMSFFHPDTGFVVGNVGVVYKTVNGGASWTSSNTGVNTSYLYASVYFTDRNTGYAVGYNGGTATSIVIKTTNGGASWSTLHTNTNNYYGTIWFVNDTTAYISGGNVANNTGSIYVTRDAGATWSTYNIGTYRLAGIEMLSSGVGFISGLNGSVVKVSCCNDGGTVEFNGSGLQRITGTSTNVKFNKLLINKSAGKLLLSNPVEVDKQLIFTKGIIGSSSTNYLQFNNGCDTVSNPSDSTYICGPVKKVGNQAFLFPLGDTLLASGAYHPLAVTAPTTATDAFTGQYYAANQAYGPGLETDSLESISNCEYWTLTRNTGSSVVIPSVGWNSNSCNIDNYIDLRTAYWDATSSQWKSMGLGGIIVDGAKGTLSAAFGFGATLMPIAIAKPKKSKEVYAVLKRKLDGGYFQVNNGKLAFKYDEEYNDADNKLTFNIYDDSHFLIASNTTMPVGLRPGVVYGDNRYVINTLNCSIGPTGRLLTGFFTLEVINEKNEKRYLRFKNSYSITLVPCSEAMPD